MAELPDNFEALLNLSKKEQELVDQTIWCAYIHNLEDWSPAFLLEEKVEELLIGIELVDVTDIQVEASARWALGVFVCKYNQVPFLATVPVNFKRSWKQGFSLTKINKLFKDFGWKLCGRKLAHQIFLRTVFAKYGERIEQQMLFRHIPKEFKIFERRCSNIKVNLSHPLPGDKDFE